MATELVSNDKLTFIEATTTDPNAHGLQLLMAFQLANMGLVAGLTRSDGLMATSRLMDLSATLGRQITTRVSHDPDSWLSDTREWTDITPERFLEIESNVAGKIAFFVTAIEATYLQQTKRFDDQLHVVPRIQPSHTTPDGFLIPYPLSNEARAEL